SSTIRTLLFSLMCATVAGGGNPARIVPWFTSNVTVWGQNCPNPAIPAWRGSGPVAGQQRVAPGQGDPEAGAAGRHGHVVQAGAVGAAEFAGDVQAQTGAVLGSGEERTPQLGGDGV